MRITPEPTDIVVPAKNVAVIGPVFMTHNDGDISIDGTSLQGYIDISYAELVEKFGEPTSADEYKVDAEWVVMDEKTEVVATVYNYKDGKNYCGEDGLETENIRDWHIGGGGSAACDLIQKIFPAHRVRTGW